ncbi:catalase family protein [Marinihelvus fidelis]|uniref:Catalase family protein n=1 Tax=Marinihelvus fidelis TaxID=2613842 RepID=A0A5N0TG35_9GAMM|nr:catalase family protein [Marinihelvus fidelis]KAA9134123.1 catalase family protein [Marinihelvus fidelis]
MIRKTLARMFILLSIVVVVSLAWNGLKERRYREHMPLGEVIGPNEDAVMADAIAMALRMINRTRDDLTEKGLTGHVTPAGLKGKGPADEALDDEGAVVFRRDVHIKTHGCVKAHFIVPEVESRFRWGLFAAPGRYPAWIRYSNGDYVMNPDKKPDARGMAIKVMDVPGEKLLAWQKTAPTQDFVMMNATNYFIRHLDDYVELTKYLAVQDNFGYFLNGWSWNPLSWRWRELRLVLGTKKKPPETPLLTQYFSASAYALGPDQYIKFSARPAECPADDGETGSTKTGNWATPRSDYNFLRLRMGEQLQAGPACFDFMVQPQVPGKPMPVEDATIAWSEKDSPFIKVARLEIPAQDFDTPGQNLYCENLSFNPWHSLPEHRPVGVFNRVRKALYEEVHKYRWAANEQQYSTGEAIALEPGQPREPNSWCLDGEQGDCAP